MNVGDTVPVTIAGQVVAQAKVVELDNQAVTLIVPATQVVMGVKTELDTAPVESEGPSVIIDDVERPSVEEHNAESDVEVENTETPQEVEQPAAVEENEDGE